MMETLKINSEIESKKLQLHWLLQITKAINYNLPAEQLFKIYETVLRDHLQVGKLALFVSDGEWRSVLSYGIDEELKIINPEKILNETSFIKDKKISAPAWLKKDESLIPVTHNNKMIAFAITGNIQSSEEFSKREVLPFIHTITNIIVVAIENKRLNKESIAQAAMKKELELAAEVQEMLIPSKLFANDKLEVDALYLPHQQVGGDYYDFISLSESEYIVCMADVSGKGIAAALLMSNFQANLHALVKRTSSLQELVHELNRCVNKTAKGEKYITFFIAQINTETGMVNYINAGHNPPVVINNGNATLLDKGTTGLGMFDELPFINEGHIVLNHDNLLFCYTDGITELENAEGVQFGIENMSLAICEHLKHDTLQTFHNWLIEEMDRFRKNIPYVDDVTILSCRYKK